ncbi:hypothetical protein LZ30DRAFT_283368 [Colletotrichum cereale]|nr:hypothetical protein LZ30DRAFT_283368 [Colletotrichum cereale]
MRANMARSLALSQSLTLKSSHNVIRHLAHSNKEAKLWRVSRASQEDAEACCPARDGQSIKQHCSSTSRQAPRAYTPSQPNQSQTNHSNPAPPTPFLKNARIMSCERTPADRRNLVPC